MCSLQLEEYTKHPNVNEMNKFFAKQFLEGRRKGVQVEALPMYHSLLKRNIVVYSISHKPFSESISAGEDKTCSDGYSACNGDPKH